MSNELPEKPQPQNQDAGSDARVVTIENLHLHASDIDALRRLSEQDPELARVVVDQKDAFDRRDHASYRFGLMAAVTLVLGTIASLTLAIVYLGVVQSLILLVAVLAVALLIRVILTGEWSETSWVGSIVDVIIRALGGAPRQ